MQLVTFTFEPGVSSKMKKIGFSGRIARVKPVHEM